MLRFCSLGSGSSGNATVVEARAGTQTTRLLVDCGFSLRALDARLARIGLCAADLDAVFITHEHSDHVGGLRPLVRRERLPVYLSEGTCRACGGDQLPGSWKLCADGESLAIGAICIEPLAVPHDAAEPLQLRCHDGARHLAILTDLGHTPEPVRQRLHGLNAVLLECNHDLDRLATSAYPESLKQRIRSDYGHLSNDQAARFLSDIRHDGLGHVVAAHLSEQNNTPEHARLALAAVLGGQAADILVADPRDGLPWVEV